MWSPEEALVQLRGNATGGGREVDARTLPSECEVRLAEAVAGVIVWHPPSEGVVPPFPDPGRQVENHDNSEARLGVPGGASRRVSSVLHLRRFGGFLMLPTFSFDRVRARRIVGSLAVVTVLLGGLLMTSAAPAAAAPKSKPACADRIDNDGDGLVDYKHKGGDPDCTSRQDDSEAAVFMCTDAEGDDGLYETPPPIPNGSGQCDLFTGEVRLRSATSTTGTSTASSLTAASTVPCPFRGRRSASATTSTTTPTASSMKDSFLRPSRTARRRAKGVRGGSRANPGSVTPTASLATAAKRPSPHRAAAGRHLDRAEG